jgi:hypothetical protein
LWHFDRVVITPFGASLGTQYGPSQGRAHTVPMLRYLTGLTSMGQTDLSLSLEHYVRARKRPGLMLLISDLLSGEPEQLGDQLRNLRSRGWQTIVAHVLDAAELSPAPMTAGLDGGSAQPAELVDLETGEHLRVVPGGDVIARYEDAVQDWLQQIEAVCAGQRADYVRLDTAWPFHTVVLRLLHARGVVE